MGMTCLQGQPSLIRDMLRPALPPRQATQLDQEHIHEENIHKEHVATWETNN
jgi:hypothetical protein